MDYYRLAECANHFLCVELANVRIVQVYSKYGTQVYNMLC